MRHDGYCTRLLWSGNRGTAKLHTRTVQINAPPELPGIVLGEIDYAPEAGPVACRVRERTGGWREMTREEVAAADAFLRRVAAPPEAPDV